VLANFGERYPTPRILAIIAAAVLAGLAFVIGGAFSLLHYFAFSAGVEGTTIYRQAEQTLIPFTVAGALGLLYLWPAAQRLVARVLPVQPGSPVVYLTVVLGLFLIAQQLGAQLEQQLPLTYGELLAQDVPFLILAFVGVGIFIRRTPAQAVDRLGLRPPVQRRWWVVAVLGIGAFMAIAFGIESVANIVAPEQQKKVTDVSNVLFANFNSPAAIIFLGLMAGIVEETLFRGAMQPRLGIVVTAVLFAALHTQYAISFATLEVLILGIGLGWIRASSGSTLPGMVTHAGYDIAVGLLPFVLK
jgi:membrane protease YdiL (CAAX protease family)